jgi:hypothetical protein
VADAPFAHVEDQRLTARAAGIVSLEHSRVVGLEGVAVGANQRLGQQWQPVQIGHVGDSRGINSRGV